jgi:hypothetical protein
MSHFYKTTEGYVIAQAARRWLLAEGDQGSISRELHGIQCKRCSTGAGFLSVD